MEQTLNHLKNSLIGSQSSESFTIFFRNSKEWDSCLSNIGYVPYFYSNLNLDFTFEIIKSKSKIAEDFSIIIKNQDNYISVFPLFVYQEGESFAIGILDRKILPPLFDNGISEKNKKQIIEIILNFLEKIKSKLNVQAFEFVDNISPSSAISQWHKIIVNNKYKCSIHREAFVDLGYQISDIRSLIRKSYKSLISKGEKLWNTQVEFKVSNARWLEFKELHLKAAGRKTRSDKSWDILQDGITNKDLLFIYCTDNNNKMIGGSIFFLTKNEAYYGIAAYDRDLFDFPIGHVIQYKAINEFKKMNLSWYRLGNVPYISDDPKPSNKEINIGTFKNGFSTHLFPQFTLSKS